MVNRTSRERGSAVKLLLIPNSDSTSIKFLEQKNDYNSGEGRDLQL